MPLRTNSAALAMIMQILDTCNATKPHLETPPQKPPFGELPEAKQPFPRAKPEEKGVSSRAVAGYIRELYADKTLDCHSVMVIKDGAVIAEADFGAYDHRIWHITHSECKSITGLAVGMLVDEGKVSLDSRIVDIFAAKIPMLSLAPITLKNLTVRHLLTMTSGIEFNEAGSVTETDWVKCILDSPLRSEPGKAFNYNSMNTYLLSAMIKEMTGEGLTDYLRPRLWEPLGIDKFFWETCPKGIEKGGWGLYIRPEDVAKIGWLLMQGGVWNGRRLISERWIAAATAPQIATPKMLCAYDYGYQIWSGRGERSFLFNGMFGQNVICFPDTGSMVVYNAGNDELFQGSGFFPITTRYFGLGYAPGSHSILPDEEGERELSRAIAEIRELTPPKPMGPALPPKKSFWDFFRKKEPVVPAVDYSALPEECALLSGRSYSMEEGSSGAVGLMPLLMQATQNNYTRGLCSVALESVNGRFTVTIGERDAAYKLPVGFCRPEYADLDFHCEPYRVGVRGKFATDEDDNLVLKLRVSFLETADSRMLKLFFKGDELTVEWSERPGLPYALTAVDMLKAMLLQNPLAAPLSGNIAKDKGYLDYLITHAIEPVTTGKLIK